MKKVFSIILTLAFVVTLMMALGTSASAATVDGVMSAIENASLPVLIIGGVLAAFVAIWAIVFVIAIIVLPFRIVFGFKVQNKKKRKKKSKKSKKYEEEPKEGLVLNAEDTKKVLVIGGCVVATSLLLNFALMSRRK